MSKALLLAVPVVMLACASSQGEPAAPSSKAADPVAEAEARAMAQVKAMQDAERQQALAAQAQMDGLMKQAQERATAQQRAEVDRQAAAEKACTDTREARITNAEQMTAARLQAEAKLVKNAPAIRATCKLVTVRTGSVKVERSGSGWRASPELANDMKCGKLPAGVEQQDAYVLLWRDSQGEKGPTGPILQPEDHDAQDAACASFDRSVGLNLDVATFDDAATWTKLIGWKPTTPTP